MTREEMIAEAKRLHASGFSIRQIEKEIRGPSRMTIWRWVNGTHDGPGAGSKRPSKGRPVKIPEVEGEGPVYPDIDPDDKDALIARLRLENDILRGVNEILKGASPGEMANSQKTSLIDYLRRTTSHPLKELTGFLRISKSSYEYQRKAQMRPDKYAGLRELVRTVFTERGRGSRGYRFVVDELRRSEGVFVSEKVVRRIMREEKLVPCWMARKRKPYSSYKGEISPAPGNLVGRNFRSALPNALWLTDITEFKLPGDEKVYLSPIRDCFDSSIVAWRTGRRPTGELANEALRSACLTLEPGEHPVIHSDRGCHYRWPGWIRICEENGLVRSMSGKACSPDNSAMEGFFGLLKKEFFYGRDWRGVTPERFMEELDLWIEDYNERRRSEALGFMTPKAYRECLGIAA